MLQPVNLSRLKPQKPEQLEGEIRSAALDEKPNRRESELDQIWSYLARTANPRWLWYAIDAHSGKVLASAFGARKDEVFLQLKS